MNNIEIIRLRRAEMEAAKAELDRLAQAYALVEADLVRHAGTREPIDENTESGSDAPNVTTGGQDDKPAQQVRGPSKVQRVRALIRDLEEPFTIDTVLRAIPAGEPSMTRHDASFALSRMKAGGEVIATVVGKGSSPSWFVRKEGPAATNE